MKGNRLRGVLALLLACAALLPMSAYTAEQYIDDVISGRQTVGKLTRLAVERHLRDLERAGEADFPYYFDAGQARRVIDFKQQLRHTKGEWADPRRHDTRIRLEPWQQFKDWVLFGWRRVEDDGRRFSKSYIEVARKAGKTTDAAATANYCFLVDRPREVGAEVYCVATKRDQAKIAWAEADRQIRAHPYLRRITRTYRQSSTVTVPGTPAVLRALGRDSDSEDGLNPHFGLVDEYHAHPDNGMLEVLESAVGARFQPLIYIITTAGFDKYSACYQEERMLAEQVLERTIEPVPETFFPLIFTLDEDDDWTDRELWLKANPNLGVTVSWQYLEQRVQAALQTPQKQNAILTKNFNMWREAETSWLSDEQWKVCGSAIDEDELAGRPCYIGIDLSATQDITAVVLCFPPTADGGRYQLLFRFFVPGDDLRARERRDKVPYTHWVKDGLIQTTPGAMVDLDFVEEQIRRDAARFAVQEVSYDPWKAHELVTHLTNEGLTMVEIRQGFASMAGPTDTFERKVLAGHIAHGNNLVMTWMVACTEVRTDGRGNIMPDKPDRKRTSKRIDGVVASIMAVGRAVVNMEGEVQPFVDEPTPLPTAAGMRGRQF